MTHVCVYFSAFDDFSTVKMFIFCFWDVCIVSASITHSNEYLIWLNEYQMTHIFGRRRAEVNFSKLYLLFSVYGWQLKLSCTADFDVVLSFPEILLLEVSNFLTCFSYEKLSRLKKIWKFKFSIKKTPQMRKLHRWESSKNEKAPQMVKNPRMEKSSKDISFQLHPWESSKHEKLQT